MPSFSFAYVLSLSEASSFSKIDCASGVYVSKKCKESWRCNFDYDWLIAEQQLFLAIDYLFVSCVLECEMKLTRGRKRVSVMVNLITKCDSLSLFAAVDLCRLISAPNR